MRQLIVILLSCTSLSVIAQNLVVNGGFERQTPKEAGVLQTPPAPCRFSGNPQAWNTCALGWRTFDMQTPDLIIRDTVNGCPRLPAPRRGNRMVGLILYHPFYDSQFAFDYHEMIQGTLVKPLEKGKTYTVSFWVYTDDSLGQYHLSSVYGRLPDILPVRCGNFGFYFSQNKIQIAENFMQSQIDFPIIPQINYPEIVATDGQWKKITLHFKADQSYKYFLFGNFFSDAVTPISMDAETREKIDESNRRTGEFWKKKKRIAYYLFDDFSMVEDRETDIEQALVKDKNYTFESAVLFDTGLATLKNESQAAISDLAAVLIRNPGMKIEIGGHTDHTGDDRSNQVLSEQRAQSVYNALISKQVPAAQLTWKGYGETRPRASNDTETGRQKNRRVECNVTIDR